jgi:hypothetical protein
MSCSLQPAVMHGSHLKEYVGNSAFGDASVETNPPVSHILLELHYIYASRNNQSRINTILDGEEMSPPNRSLQPVGKTCTTKISA